MHRLSSVSAVLFSIAAIVPMVSFASVSDRTPSNRQTVLRYASPTTTPETRLTLRAEGEQLVLVDDDSGRVVSSSPAAATNRVTIRGADGDHNDTLTVDLSRPLHIPGGIDFDGGSAGWDTLIVTGGSTAHEAVTELSKSDGIIALDDLTIRYTNLEPITDTVAAAVLTITGTAAAEAFTMTDGPISGGFQTTTISAPTIEAFTFANKTEVNINGNGGADSLTINNPNPAVGLTTFATEGVQTISQSGPLIVTNFLVLISAGPGSVVLTDASNAISNIAVTAHVPYTLVTSLPLNCTQVASSGFLITSFGIFTANNPVSLTSSGGITLSQAINAGSAAVSLTGTSFAGSGNPNDVAGTPTSFTDSSAVGKTWTVGTGSVTAGASTPISLNGGTAVMVTGGTGSDIFNVTPGSAAAITIDGNTPIPPATPGDTLTINTSGLTAPHLTFTSTANGFQGTETFGDAMPVNFSHIETGTVPTHFVVTAPASAEAGLGFNSTVTVLDALNAAVPGYTSLVHFTSTDAQAVLCCDSIFTGSAGTLNTTFKTAGNQTITATDVNPSITGTSNTITVSATIATHFTVSAPSNATAGTAFSFTVTALDPFNNTATGYTRTVHFTSSDAQAVLPANATLTNGVGTFASTLKTAGNQTITATDTVFASVTGTSNTVAVGAAAATHFAVSAPATATAGAAFNFTVTALDQFNNTASAYAGTVHFTSSDAQAVLPADSTLTSGVGTFASTLKTTGNQTITATDTLSASIAGTSNTIVVSAAAATHFVVSAPAAASANIAFNFTVTALDQFNNTATSYAGTVHFTSGDAVAVLPANATLTNGAGTFSATLKTSGNQTITATDTVTASITGTSASIAVTILTADVGITKTASAPAPFGGQNVTYTIVATNAGPSTASAVTVTDTLPAGLTLVSATSTAGTCSGATTITCSLATLTSGASATITLVATAPAAGGTISNTATVSATEVDPNPANNSSTANVTLQPAAGIPAFSTTILLMLLGILGMIGATRIRM